jgi:hypothetical protein
MMWSVVGYDKVHRMDLNGEEATNSIGIKRGFTHEDKVKLACNRATLHVVVTRL